MIYKSGGFAWEGSNKCLVPGLVPVGSALVQVAKNVFFTGNQLGSGLGSTWFLLGSSLCDPQKQRFRLGRDKQMLGSQVVPLGSILMQRTKKVVFARSSLGSWLGSAWFPLGSTLF